jgi:hypothetical protein
MGPRVKYIPKKTLRWVVRAAQEQRFSEAIDSAFIDSLDDRLHPMVTVDATNGVVIVELNPFIDGAMRDPVRLEMSEYLYELINDIDKHGEPIVHYRNDTPVWTKHVAEGQLRFVFLHHSDRFWTILESWEDEIVPALLNAGIDTVRVLSSKPPEGVWKLHLFLCPRDSQRPVKWVRCSSRDTAREATFRCRLVLSSEAE